MISGGSPRWGEAECGDPCQLGGPGLRVVPQVAFGQGPTTASRRGRPCPRFPAVVGSLKASAYSSRRPVGCGRAELLAYARAGWPSCKREVMVLDLLTGPATGDTQAQPALGDEKTGEAPAVA